MNKGKTLLRQIICGYSTGTCLFRGQYAFEKIEDVLHNLSLLNANQSPKKKRKSRTSFTNLQLFELEKRFLYQKYVSPAVRDEIAATLGITNAQVITWFQNRRAKLKRDMEEVRRVVEGQNARDEVEEALNASTSGSWKKKLSLVSQSSLD
ncbi:hypothetical protein NQ318_006423 [Aromia moschata]|uniref:Homeobox domain-containing protein n=1 Tax=Aromia moschata TaxID=1265417 RepID=A0AAV8XRV0_9CUCU|nr:hypothetical protein NQ318_006423 [Aromia moschata]